LQKKNTRLAVIDWNATRLYPTPRGSGWYKKIYKTKEEKNTAKRPSRQGR